MRVVQFFMFPIIHEGFFGRPPSKGDTKTKLVAGVVATLPSSVAITPLENAKIALQLDHQKKFNNSMGKAVKHLLRRGVLAPYMGCQGVFTRSALSFRHTFVTFNPPPDITRRVSGYYTPT